MNQPMALEDIWWKEDAQDMIQALAKSGRRFDVNDLRRDLREAPRPNMYGAAFITAKKRGVIVEAPVVAGRAMAKQSHGRRVVVWEAAPAELAVAA